MRAPIRVAALAAVVTIAMACAAEPPSTPGRVSHPAQLAGTAWRLVELGGTAPAAGTAASLIFTGDQVGGTAPCNSFGARYAYDPVSGALRFDQLISTKRACAIGPGGELEAAYFSALRTVSGADMDSEGRLVLASAAGRIVFEVAGQPVGAPATANPRSS